MKKKRVNEILINQTKRRKTLISFFCIIFIISVLILSFFLIFLERNKIHYITYSENSNIDYKVLLTENEFFEDTYLDSNKQYIASLVDYISATFSYNLNLEELIDYKYSYRLESSVDVKQKETGNSLFNKKETLKTSEEILSNKIYTNINEQLKIDYNYYNDLISRFVRTYGLDGIESNLTISMYVNVVGSCEDSIENKNERVMSLTIPLTTKTMNIDISNNLINNENNVMQCENQYRHNNFLLVIICSLLVSDLVFIFNAISFIIKSRTAENIYEKELKKILNNYSSYIQGMSSDFSKNDYQVVTLESFTDMLEIRDTIRQPILMKENDNKTSSYFVIPTETKILYIYYLRVSDIKKTMRKNNEKRK